MNEPHAEQPQEPKRREPDVEIAFFTEDQLITELAKRHTALIVAGERTTSGYYCYREGNPLALRGLASLVRDAVKRSVTRWEKGD